MLVLFAACQRRLCLSLRNSHLAARRKSPSRASSSSLLIHGGPSDDEAVGRTSSERPTLDDNRSLGALGFTPGGREGNPAAFSERTVLLEEAKNPWRGPRQLVNIVCIGGGGASSYFAITGLLARSMNIEATSVQGQSNGEVLLGLAIDIAALVYGISSYLKERRDREACLRRISLNEEGELSRLRSEDERRSKGSMFD